MSKPKETKSVNDSAVARILTDAINKSTKTQTEIAHEVGFNRPNMMSMIKQGFTPVPIYKVKLLADCLGISAKDLLDCCMREYRPEEWGVIREVYGLETDNVASSSDLLDDFSEPPNDHIASPACFVDIHSTMLKQAEAIIANKLEPIKPGNEKIVGFQTKSGRQLALQRDVQRINVWTEDLDSPEQIAPYERYSADRSRHSNLASHAPRLATGNEARLWRPESGSQLQALVTWYSGI